MAVTAVFDLDGTISNPLPGIARSINFALAYYGIEPLPEEEVARHVGPPIDETFRALTGGALPVGGLVEKYRERYGEVGYSENKLYPGIPEVLGSLGDAGISMAVCTSKRKDFAERIIQMFGLSAYFQFVHGGDIGIAKSDQLGMLREEGRIDGRSWMIGDRCVDILAAKATGIKAVAVGWGFGSEAELASCEPDHYVGSPEGLLSLLFNAVEEERE